MLDFDAIDLFSSLALSSQLGLCEQHYFCHFWCRYHSLIAADQRLDPCTERPFADADFTGGELRMHVRSLFEAVEVLASRVLQSWTAGWSVPTDEVFVSARLPLRHVDASGGVAERWLLKVARSTAAKWRGEVCGIHRGRVQSVVIARAGLSQLTPTRMHGAVHVTARYCGRLPDGGFCFRHGLFDRSGSEILHFVSQIYFSPEPELPAYPAIQINSDNGTERLYQSDMCSKANKLPSPGRIIVNNSKNRTENAQHHVI
ncbi:hypothetical protein [Bosea sp. WAO]|uniref:hypothetical protein n=1 Tax=Bosea sp. WAO TaxID=406341 RepID=UPI0012EDDA5C|nr:hypothetical protein [Bosea sp. WAO]